MKTRHIEIIREQLGVGYAAISRYNSEHKNEIEDIWKIFYLKGDSKEKVLALLYMFSSGSDDDAVQKYREQTGLNSSTCSVSTLLEQYKVLLITAMVYNEAFYAMAVNFRSSVEAGGAIEEVEEDTIVSSPINMVDFESPSDLHINSQRSAATRHFSRTSSFTKTRRRITISIGAVAALALIFSGGTALLSSGLNPLVNKEWLACLSEPENAAKIELYSPVSGIPAGAGSQDKTDNIKTTIKNYSKAIRADKNNADLYINRGIAYTLDGRPRTAIKDFNRAITISNSQNASAYYNRAIANAGKKAEMSAVVADFETAIKLDSGNNDASNYAIGVLYWMQYKKNKAPDLRNAAINAFDNIQEKNYKDVRDILKELND